MKRDGVRLILFSKCGLEVFPYDLHKGCGDISTVRYCAPSVYQLLTMWVLLT